MNTTKTFGPCCRCHKSAKAVAHTARGLVVLHWEKTAAPCPIRPGEMPEYTERGRT